MARRLDRRVQRTRKLLRESLMALILEEGYDEISIQDITDKANLGRATFYLHFKDKEELLLDVMDQFMSSFLDQVPQFSENQWRLEEIKPIVKLFDFAAENYDLYRIMIIGSGGITASRQLHRSIADNIKACVQSEIKERGAEPIVPVDFIANHFAGSLLATIYWWLDNDLPYTVEEMAEMFQKVSQLDRQRLMGVKEEKPETKEDKEKRKKRGKDNSKKDKQDPESEVVTENGGEDPEPEPETE
jgi:AcrR family transcriptional regulator